MKKQVIIKCDKCENLITINKITKKDKNEITINQKLIKTLKVNKHFVCKCKNCETTIGVHNKANEQYILFKNTCEINMINYRNQQTITIY